MKTYSLSLNIQLLCLFPHKISLDFIFHAWGLKQVYFLYVKLRLKLSFMYLKTCWSVFVKTQKAAVRFIGC